MIGQTYMHMSAFGYAQVYMYVHVFCLQALPAEEEDSARQEKPQQRNQTPSQGKRKRSGQETAKPKLRKRMPLPPQATTGHITVAHVPPSGTVCVNMCMCMHIHVYTV